MGETRFGAAVRAGCRRAAACLQLCVLLDQFVPEPAEFARRVVEDGHDLVAVCLGQRDEVVVVLEGELELGCEFVAFEEVGEQLHMLRPDVHSREDHVATSVVAAGASCGLSWITVVQAPGAVTVSTIQLAPLWVSSSPSCGTSFPQSGNTAIKLLTERIAARFPLSLARRLRGWSRREEELSGLDRLVTRQARRETRHGGTPALVGLTVFVVGALVFELGCVPFDLNVAPLELGAYLVASLVPEFDGPFVCSAGLFVPLRGLAAAVASLAHVGDPNWLAVGPIERGAGVLATPSFLGADLGRGGRVLVSVVASEGCGRADGRGRG